MTIRTPDAPGPRDVGAAGPAIESQAWRTASPSISILIFLPTITPPVSRATFQVRPKSSRSISVLRGEAEDVLAERAAADALELDLQLDRPGDVLDGQLAGEHELVAGVAT